MEDKIQDQKHITSNQAGQSRIFFFTKCSVTKVNLRGDSDIIISKDKHQTEA
jgi:hypothetical protein